MSDEVLTRLVVFKVMLNVDMYQNFHTPEKREIYSWEYKNNCARLIWDLEVE